MRSIKMLVLPVTAVLTLAGAGSEINAKRDGSAVRDARYADAVAVRVDGVAQKVGNGTTRAYILVDQKTGAPLEIGVALSENALDGLPAPMKMSAAEMA